MKPTGVPGGPAAAPSAVPRGVPARPVELEVGDLRLSTYRARDVDQVLAAFTDPDIARWNPGPTDDGRSRLLIRSWIERRNDWSSGGHASWGVFRDGNLVGSVSVHSVDLAQETAEIGYWTVPAARGQGVATRAVLAATAFAFDVIGVYRLELVHAVDNRGSCRVAYRSGFALEGLLREAYRYGDGMRYDEHLHARLRHDPVGYARDTGRPGQPGQRSPVSRS